MPHSEFYNRSRSEGTLSVVFKLTKELRLHYSYPDSVSSRVEQEYYATGRKLPKDFTGFLSRKERLAGEQHTAAAQLLNPKPSAE